MTDVASIEKLQSIDLQSKSMDWFLYDRDFYHEKVNIRNEIWRRSFNPFYTNAPLSSNTFQYSAEIVEFQKALK